MSSSTAVVCKEVFDENSQPSAEEISEYAQQIGIDLESESHLLPLAKDGLLQPLPPPWKAYYDEKLQTHYYYNEETKKTQWEHPLDNVYRELVRKARDDDTCASVQELLTSEDNTKQVDKPEAKIDSDNEDLSTDSDNSDEKKSPNLGIWRLQPLAGRPPLAPVTRTEKKLSDLKISPLRRSIDSVKPSTSTRGQDRPLEKPRLFKQQSEIIDLKMHVLNSPDDDNFSPLISGKMEKGFALAGKGSIFLKTKKQDLPSPDTEKSFTQDSLAKSDPPRGILREKSDGRKEPLIGRPRLAASFEDDRKSVRFNLDNSNVDFENTVSPGSNSSSSQNEGQSVISSPPYNPNDLSPNLTPITPSIPPSVLTPLSPVVLSPLTTVPLSSAPLSSVPFTPMSTMTAPLAPLVSRPPLPPRPQSSVENSPREASQVSVSGSERESNESDKTSSPRRRVIRPPAGHYIKPELFQKNFQKISDLVRPGDLEPHPVQTLTVDDLAKKETRPRSPMIPQMNKISINLMESIDSETSIDSPDKEFANLDLNDLDDSKIFTKDLELKDSDNSDANKNAQKPKDIVPQIITPKLELIKKDDVKKEEKSSRSDSLDLGKDSSQRVPLSPQLKSHSLSISSYNDNKSPRNDLTEKWSAFKPINKVPLMKTDSSGSLTKISSPRLDGVILSQNKNDVKSSDNVVVVYQFENNADDNLNRIKAKTDLNREIFERNKSDEKRRLELLLSKTLEEMRGEWMEKEKRKKAELVEELCETEEKFCNERKRRLMEQAERHRREMDEALIEAKRSHEASLKALADDYEERLRRETELTERKYEEKLAKLREEFSRNLADEQIKLRIENERTISETREQLHGNLIKERSRIIEENKFNVDALREEHANRITELRHDYRAEVERLRTQHACHLEELRVRLSGERAGVARRQQSDNLHDKYRCLKEKYERLKHDVKMSIERRNKRRELSMTTGSDTEKSNSHKTTTQSAERCKELNEMSANAEPEVIKRNNNPVIKFNDNETSLSESNAQKLSMDNNNEEWRNRKEIISPETSQTSGGIVKPPKKTVVAFRELPRRRRVKDDKQPSVTTDCQDSSDATTADEKPKEVTTSHGRRRCFTRLKSASTSRLNYSPKRGEGWSSPLESLRQQLRKLDDLEDQFPDLACQPSYSLRYPFAELEPVSTADTPELEFVRHRALVEREGMRRARAALRRRRDALKQGQTQRPQSDAREATELEVALHRARALLGEKEIRLRHIERSLRQLSTTHAQPPPIVSQEGTMSEGSSGSDLEAERCHSAANGAVLRSLRALHADVRDIWRALDATRPTTASPETSSCVASNSQPNASLNVSHPRMTLSADAAIQDGGVAERARSLRAWLQGP